MQEGTAMVLGTCFRLLANEKNKSSDSVVNTAAATVRQVCRAPQHTFELHKPILPELLHPLNKQQTMLSGCSLGV